MQVKQSDVRQLVVMATLCRYGKEYFEKRSEDGVGTTPTLGPFDEASDMDHSLYQSRDTYRRLNFRCIRYAGRIVLGSCPHLIEK